MLVKPKSVWLLDHSAAILWQLENLLKMLSSCGTFAIVLFYSNKQLAVHEKIFIKSNTVSLTNSPLFMDNICDSAGVIVNDLNSLSM